MYSYVITFTLLLTVTTNICQYFYLKRPSKASLCARWTPFSLMLLATVLLLISPMKNVVVNLCMASFKRHGFDPIMEHIFDIAFNPMLSEGWIQAYTAVAYVSMFVATVLQIDLVKKFQESLKKQRANALQNAEGV